MKYNNGLKYYSTELEQHYAAHGMYDVRDEHDACGVGLVAAIDALPRRDVIDKAIAALKSVWHRGAVNADGKTGDGAGIHLQIPHEFFASIMPAYAQAMREGAQIGVGMLFLPRTDANAQEEAKLIIETEVAKLNMRIIGWRQVPNCPEIIGDDANFTRPEIMQVFMRDNSPLAGESLSLGEAVGGKINDEFERNLYVVRRRIERKLRNSAINDCYICSLSSRIIIYKGLFQASHLSNFYPELNNPLLTSSYAIFHQRFSTNTAPSWAMAQPFRMIAHNGEINTLRGNVNWMSSYEACFGAELFADVIDDLTPIVPPSGSDTAMLDSVMEFVTLSGKELPFSKLMLIPPAWRADDELIPEAHKALYEYLNCLMSPWDGPAAIVACDGNWVVAGTDRNGLRPLRYALTKDGLLTVGSETGMVGLASDDVLQLGQLSPGELIGVDLRLGKYYSDVELKDYLAGQKDYSGKIAVVKKLDFSYTPHGSTSGFALVSPTLPQGESNPLQQQNSGLLQQQYAAGLSAEDIDMVLLPMLRDGKEAVGSMGDDTPLAVMSEHYRGLHHFFRQHFSQVTNPPIDPLRETHAMSLATKVGMVRNVLGASPDLSAIVHLDSPILMQAEMQALQEHFADKHSAVLDCTYVVNDNPNALRMAIDELLKQAGEAISNGAQMLVLCDMQAGVTRIAIPAILAAAAVHTHMVRLSKRKQLSIISRTCCVIDTHSMAVLIGVGATAVYPYLMEQTTKRLVETGKIKFVKKISLPTKPSPPTPLPEVEGKTLTPTLSQREREFSKHFSLNQHIVTFARELRQNSSNVTEALWQILRNNNLQVKFRRQHPIDNLIIDFYCHKLKLAIEIFHVKPDKLKKEYLNAKNIKLLQFHHQAVLKDINKFIDIIIDEIEILRDIPSPFGRGQGEGDSPLPLGEGLGVRANDRQLPNEFEAAIKNLRHAYEQGMLKIMSKMGISVISSYRGGRNFDAIGLSRATVAEFFPGLVSRISGIGLQELQQKIKALHDEAYGYPPRIACELRSCLCCSPARGEQIPVATMGVQSLPVGGFYRYRNNGEKHAYEADLIHRLQTACATGSYKQYLDFANGVNAQDAIHIRSLLEFNSDRKAISLQQVESVQNIRKRFIAPAMSLGSLSPEAHQTLAIAMNRIGAASNSGEGGEGKERYQPLANGDNANSSIKQVASGRFGVTAQYLQACSEIQIKVAQGAKPGEGGQLPSFKVTAEIARLRHTTIGTMLISPPPHHDIYSIEDLAQLIYDLKQINPNAIISVKLVAQSGIGTIASGVVKALADKIIISGHVGGTGASPLSSIKFAGVPWEMGLAEVSQVLAINKLRHRVRLQTDGGLKVGRDIVIAAMLGADEYAIGTLSLVAMGCLLVRQCHSNTCPVGICTQNEQLRKHFDGTPEKVINLMSLIAEDVRGILAELGYASLDEIIGRTDLLRQVVHDNHEINMLDLTPLLTRPTFRNKEAKHEMRPYNAQPYNKVAEALDSKIIAEAGESLRLKQKVQLNYTVHNTDRTIGAGLSHYLLKHLSGAELQDDLVELALQGTAGQSLGAFLVRGITINLQGDANDYVGKGLSGGRIIIRPDPASGLASNQNAIIGNTVLYGATSGELYAAGIAGERFAVRNSGAIAVIEGCGSNALEYMTGGVVVILGRIGNNIAAGMTGGRAYIYDEMGILPQLINLENVGYDKVMGDGHIVELQQLVKAHVRHTNSLHAQNILEQWEQKLPHFWVVQPI
jgi:glutamate synthase domain-containing protein 2/glutamate synthase domain-containing protein 1/glutamate synthase domain-containing protein 3/very-short-patch-repair endonuclease